MYTIIPSTECSILHSPFLGERKKNEEQKTCSRPLNDACPVESAWPKFFPFPWYRLSPFHTNNPGTALYTCVLRSACVLARCLHGITAIEGSRLLLSSLPGTISVHRNHTFGPWLPCFPSLGRWAEEANLFRCRSYQRAHTRTGAIFSFCFSVMGSSLPWLLFDFAIHNDIINKHHHK